MVISDSMVITSLPREQGIFGCSLASALQCLAGVARGVSEI